jgi:hypothetical protein
VLRFGLHCPTPRSTPTVVYASIGCIEIVGASPGFDGFSKALELTPNSYSA